MIWLVTQLFDLPSLVLTCCKGGLYDEAVDVLIFADEVSASVLAAIVHGCLLLMTSRVH